MISVVSALESPHFCLNTKICTFGNDKTNLSKRYLLASISGGGAKSGIFGFAARSGNNPLYHVHIVYSINYMDYA